jgi:type I restriction enzyme S subunit
MPIKMYIIDLQEIAKDSNIRIGKPYTLPKSKYSYEKLIKFLLTYESGTRPKGGIFKYGEDEVISLGGEQIGRDGSVDLSKIPYVSYKFYKKSQKGKVQHMDILICKDGALTGKTCIVDSDLFPHDKIMVNEHVYIIRANEKINQKFLYYLTRTELFQCQIKNLAYKKKAQPGLNLEHLSKIKIPKMSKSLQGKIITVIEPIEKKIKGLKLQIKEPFEIINKIFAEEFNYSQTLWKEFGKGMTAGTQKSYQKNLTWFSIQSSQIAHCNLLRFSSRFHNPITIKLNRILERLDLWLVEEVINDIKKGVQPSYDTDGDVKVVKIANMKNGYIDFSEAEFVNEQFYESVKKQAGIDKGDILLCCTGKVSLGKIDYYDLDESTILSVDSYIIRLNEVNVHPLFFTYFFRGILGAYQIERDYTGTTNQIHLYNTQIKEFRLPKIEMNCQKKIADRIKKALDKQKTIEIQIKEKQNEISIIIEEAIKLGN